MELFKILGTIAINGKEALSTLGQVGGAAAGTVKKVSSAAVTVGKVVGAGVAAAATAIGTLTKNAIESYAEYEQLVGGVDTLFGKSSAQVQAYAAEAFAAVGMSANDYMTTVTGFSASLIQSLGGDTTQAAKIANQAITDMADNANKMGTSMESIQNAYQGFAKQNYTMLDNLKLGYGGTKEEMQRLLDEAAELSGMKFDISNFADIVQAIHVVQEKMGIAGATAAEAASTIEGSLNMTKAAWANLVTGLANEDADLSGLIGNLVSSVEIAAGNILPHVETVLGGVVQLISTLAPQIALALPGLFSAVLPGLVEGATGIVSALSSVLPGLVDSVLMAAPQLINGFEQVFLSLANALPNAFSVLLSAIPALVGHITENFDQFLQIGWEIISAIGQALIDNLPALFMAGAEIIYTIMDAANSALVDLVSLGASVVASIAEGISNAWDSLVGWFRGLWGSLFGGLSVNVGANVGGGVDGSHAGGLDYVPFDGYLAELHKGEMVLTATQANAVRDGEFGAGSGEVTAMLGQVLGAIKQMDANMGGNLAHAIEGASLNVNSRDFGRLVKAVN